MPLRNQNLAKILNILLLILLVIVYQSLLSGPLSIHQIKLDLPLLILVYVALTQGPVTGAVFGFLIGILLDLSNPSILGLGALIKTCLGYLVGGFKGNLFLESNVSRAAIIFLALLFNDLAYYLFSGGVSSERAFFVFLNYSLLSGVYTALAGLVFLWYKQMRRAREITA